MKFNVTSCSGVHWVNLFLRTLACKWSGLLYLLVVLIMVMRYYEFDDMLFGCIYIDMCYWLGSPECAGLWTSRMQRHQWNPLDSGSSQGVDCWVWMLLMWHMYIWLNVMMIDYYCWHNSLMDDVDDNLLTKLTYGIEGLRTTTRDIEGEVWHQQQPCHNLLALPSWLEL